MNGYIFLHLKMQGAEIYFHKEQKECDFVIRKGNQIVQVIQVTTHLANEDVRKREIAGLTEAMETYGLSEGLILTEDSPPETLKVKNFQITITPIWKWLLAI